MRLDFEALATQYVGDGNTPNLYFVTDNTSNVLAVVTTTLEDAENVASTLGAYLVEDRLTGIVWTSEAFDRLHACNEEM
jgi:hypothetical protein